MKAWTWLGLVLAIATPACGGSQGASDGADDGEESEGAVVAGDAVALASAHYDAIDLVVKDGKVSGRFSDFVGDPARGGATCEFTFAGAIEAGGDAEHAKIIATDGWDSTAGELRAIAAIAGDVHSGKIALHLDSLLNACSRVAPVLEDPDGLTAGGVSKMEPDVLGYRSVSAERAHFYDAPDAEPRSAYLVKGDTAIVIGAEAQGFVKARFKAATTTTGLLALADLAVPRVQ
jgi:hypothetical protein